MASIVVDKRAGTVRTRVKSDGTLTVEQDWFFRIRADSIIENRASILLDTPGTPKYGVIYNGIGLLKGCDATRMEEDPLLWEATFNLSNQVEEGSDKDPSDGTPQMGQPTEWVPVVELGFEDYEEVFTESLSISSSELDTSAGGSETDGVGYNATKWINSAGQPYENGFVRQRRIITRRFTQFEPITGPNAVTLDQIEARNDTLNNATYLGKPKRTLKLSVDAVAAGFYYNLRCWRVDYVLAYKSTDWRLKVLDVGWYYKDGSGDLQPFKDDAGNNIQGALDGDGDKATDQLEPAIRAHKEFESIDFSAFLRLE
jgi:hypothetical protein